MNRIIICIICSVAVVSSGCNSKEHATELVDKTTQSLNQIPPAVIAAKRAELAGDPGPLDEFEEKFTAFDAKQRADFANMKQELAEQKKLVQGIISGLTTVAIESLPAGSTALNIAKGVLGQVDGARKKTVTEANLETEKVKTIAEGNKEDIATLKKKTEVVDKATAGLEDKLKEIKGEVKNLANSSNDMDKSFALAQAKLDSLSVEIRQKLGKVPESVLDELKDLKDDDVAFRELLKETARLTNEEMKSLDGMSTEELIAVLVAALGAAGAGGALGKTGRSRGAKDIDDIRKEIIEIDKRLPR